MATRFGAGNADVVPFRPRRESVAERLERQWREQERADGQRRERVERERATRERALLERLEQRRRERLEQLRRERESQRRRDRVTWRRRRRKTQSDDRPRARRKMKSAAPEGATDARPEARPASTAQARPRVQGPVRKRARGAENRQRAAARRRGLAWPTTKAGLAVTLALGLSVGLGTVLGLTVPGPDAGAGQQSLASSAALFGVDAGTPTGLAPGYVFPILGRHDFGERIARFGAPRYGHIHEGQDIFAKTGTPEVAVHDGVVVDRGKVTDADSGGRGNYIAIYDPADNHSFVYMHMVKPSPLQLGQHVKAGEMVGQVGCTGECDGPHLHFEVRIGKASIGAETKPVDPLPFLRRWPQPTPG
jgi:murein DD-endopeptidase MepM/ murein hydrolase activator NlpD